MRRRRVKGIRPQDRPPYRTDRHIWDDVMEPRPFTFILHGDRFNDNIFEQVKEGNEFALKTLVLSRAHEIVDYEGDDHDIQSIIRTLDMHNDVTASPEVVSISVHD